MVSRRTVVTIVTDLTAGQCDIVMIPQEVAVSSVSGREASPSVGAVTATVTAVMSGDDSCDVR